MVGVVGSSPIAPTNILVFDFCSNFFRLDCLVGDSGLAKKGLVANFLEGKSHSAPQRDRLGSSLGITCGNQSNQKHQIS